MMTLISGARRFAAALALAGGLAAAPQAPAQNKIIKVDGSSTVYPVTEAVAEEFQNANRGLKVTVGVSGTGGGFKKFARGETDISNASRPIMKEEMSEAAKNGVQYIELPICFDALTVVVHPQNTWVDHLTTAELKKMWEPGAQGKSILWSDIRAGWPAEKIDLYGPGADSGTFDYFTEAIVGKAKSSRGDYTASEDDNILVRGVEGNRYALGYFGYAYYEPHKEKLKAVPIDWDKDTIGPVAPSAQTVLNGTYNPLSRPLFIYVNKRSVETKPEVRLFVEFYIKYVPELASQVKYMPLPPEAYKPVSERLKKLQTGTAFGGEPTIGVPIAEIVNRPLKN
ncbi:MAG: PstS family phosphate ABC transporter substrate-binding protein [Phycisphaerales bacterium]